MGDLKFFLALKIKQITIVYLFVKVCQRSCWPSQAAGFDESNNGILSEGFNELNLNKYINYVSDDELDANDQNENVKYNMRELIQSLKVVEEKQVAHNEDSQPDLETNAHDLGKPLRRTDFDTPTKDFSKEVGTSSLYDLKPFILRSTFRLSSQHPQENIISDPNKGSQTGSSPKSFCAFYDLFLLQNRSGSLLYKVNSMSLKENNYVTKLKA